MRKKHLKKAYAYIIVLSAVLLTAVMLLMNHVKQRLLSDVSINLTEIVTQNKDVITSKLMLEVNNLELVSKQLSERISFAGDSSDMKVKEMFLNYAERGIDDMLCYSDREGHAVYGSGEEASIAGRQYFLLALQGKANISERIISRLNGEDIFVISVPLNHEGEIIGTIQKQYMAKEMYDICSASLFSQQGSMYIINSEGYILINSEYEEQYNKESSNYYRMLFLDNPKVAKKLEMDIETKQEGFFEAQIGKERVFSAYTPIEEIHDWYLITSINTNAVMPNAVIVIKIFYGILFAVILFAVAMMMYLLLLKRKQSEELEKIAFVDEVTAGDTYTKFMINVQELFEQNPKGQFSMLVFDIDNFKYINAFYGFDKGDEILKCVYKLYRENMGKRECLARITADHFVAVLQDVSEDRLREIFCAEKNISGVKVYFSAGLYPIKDIKEGLGLMMDKANLASRRTKGRRHKGVGVYSTEYDKELAKNERIKREVEQAVSQGEIIPFFQPKVDIHTGKLAGAEALARWITSTGKLIPPDEFIPACEHTGTIDKIDWAIFDATLAFIKRSMEMGIQCVPISVNFSRTHLFDIGFSENLRQKMMQQGVPAKLIEVELTETIIFDNAENINRFIEELHEIGVKVSMDDFGSGYSSLHMLKDVNIDVLKIDRGFLKGTTNSKKQQAIFEAIAQMANKLELEVVVEGVETTENVELMKKVKYNVAQGYFYSRPVDAERFSTMYKEGTV